MTAYQKAVEDYYLRQAKGAPYFQSPAFQRGHGLGGIFRALMRVASPIFHSAAPTLKAGAKAIAKDALRTGAEIASDALLGRDIGESVEQHAKEAAGRLVNKGTKKLISMIDSPQPKRRRKTIKGRRAIKYSKQRDIFNK
ncbi:MAG: hypothetical protein MJA29_04215 [Candidatus Omnitrophica bacterium]|nr:hypothetical protein [Candidatus Omnitrophota bacterium]